MYTYIHIYIIDKNYFWIYFYKQYSFGEKYVTLRTPCIEYKPDTISEALYVLI